MRSSLCVILFGLMLTGTPPAGATGQVTLLRHLFINHGMSGPNYYSNCWGYTDSTGREYALMGSVTGTSIVEITIPDSAREVAFIPGPSSSWREIKTHSHYAYVVSEGGGGTQIINLSQLPDTAWLANAFTHTSGGKNTSRVHSISIHDGVMFLNGCATWSPGGVVMFSLANPEQPAFLGEFATEYIHDSFVRNDTLFGSDIYSPGGLYVVDISNKSNPQTITEITYPGAGTHNAWTTEDGQYVLTTDEIGNTPKTLKVWDIRNLPTYTKVADFTVDPTATVHNVHIKGRYAYVAWYAAGVHVVDIANPAQPVHAGGYDTYPGTQTSPYNGCWGVFPFYNSNKFIACDRYTGLYILELDTTVSAVGPLESSRPAEFALHQNYPNPFNPRTIINYQNATKNWVTLKVYDVLGREMASLVNEIQDSGLHSVAWDASGQPSGVYFYRLRSGTLVEQKKMILMK
ncbi:MAG: choice-of-anchor B family protein [Bacteroidota bacterium]